MLYNHEPQPSGDGAPQVLPFWMLCDRSLSMAGSPIAAVNAALPELQQALRREFDVAEKVRVGLVGFADDAAQHLALADLGFVEALTDLHAAGSTNYSAAFATMRVVIETEVRALQRQGLQVLRPVVFFLSDGMPNGGPEGDWCRAYNDLIDPGFGFRPHIIAFGIGEADPNVIRHVATLRAYVADDNTGTAEAVREWATRLTQSVVQSARAVNADGVPTLAIPPTPTGFHDVPLDVLPVS